MKKTLRGQDVINKQDEHFLKLIENDCERSKLMYLYSMNPSHQYTIYQFYKNGLYKDYRSLYLALKCIDNGLPIHINTESRYNLRQLNAISKIKNTDILKLLNASIPSFLITKIESLIKSYKVETIEIINTYTKYNNIEIVLNYCICTDIIRSFDKDNYMRTKLLCSHINSDIVTAVLMNLGNTEELKNAIFRIKSIKESKDASRSLDLKYDFAKKVLLSEFPFLKETQLFLNTEEIVKSIVVSIKEDTEEMVIDPYIDSDYINIIEDFILLSGGDIRRYTVIEYCYQFDIDIDVFQSAVDYIKEYDVSLYKKYLAFVRKKKVSQCKMNTAKKIINGIQIPGFTLYDYFAITKIMPTDMHNIILHSDCFTKDDLILFNKFMDRYKYSSTVQTIKWFYDEHMVINGKEVTKLDIDKVLSFMKSNKFPLITSVYKEIVRRYKKQQLIID